MDHAQCGWIPEPGADVAWRSGWRWLVQQPDRQSAFAGTVLAFG
jgi:hypothetical protein